MTAEEKALLDAQIETVTELKDLIRESLPIRAVGGGHVHNELLKVIDNLTRLSANVTVQGA